METKESTPGEQLNQQIAEQLPALEGLSIVAGPIENHLSELFPVETQAVTKAIEKRQWEFATGRSLARQAMSELGMPRRAVARGEDREPLWPAGCKGSITHAADLAVVGVAHADVLTSVGLDLEDAERVTADMFSKLFTEPEQLELVAGDPRLAGVFFSAKEAGYKATFPQVGRFIGFQEAEVVVDWPERRFQLRYLGDFEPNQIMETGEGYFLFCEPYVLSLFIIP